VCHRLRAAPGPTRVLWAPAPTSRRRTTPGAPRVSSGQLQGQHPPLDADQLRGHHVSPAQGSSRAGTCPMGSNTHLLAHDSSEGSTCPCSSRPNEDRRANAEDLAEPDRCMATPIRSKQNKAQGAAADSYRIDPDPICDGSAVADRKAAASCLGVVTKKRRLL
jgi:hypothetical protein